jgi:hypothetical protein
MPKVAKNIVEKRVYSKESFFAKGYYTHYGEFIGGKYEEKITLEDLSLNEVKTLLQKYKTSNIGGSPGSRGVLLAWQKYWIDVIEDYLKQYKMIEKV